MLKRIIYMVLFAALASHVFAMPLTHSNLALQDNGAGTRLLHELTLLLVKHQAMIVRDKQTGKIYSTRATNFTTDWSEEDKIKIVRNDLVLQGYAYSKLKNSNYIDVRIPINNISPEPTSVIGSALINLSSQDEVIQASKFDPSDSRSFNFLTLGTIYDSAGNKHKLLIYFVKKDINKWELPIIVDDDAIVATGTVLFDASGAPSLVSGIDDVSVRLGGADQKIKFNLLITQYASVDQPGIIFNNGHATGLFINYKIRDNGVIVAEYSNGLTKEVSRIALVN
jgi:flagellar hook protein FlgE